MTAPKKLLVACALAVVAALALAPGAAADGTKCNPGCEASVEWRERGEIFIVHDNKADGRSAYGLLQIWVGDHWNSVDLWNTNGFHGPPERGSAGLEEGRRVRYMACKGEFSEGVLYDCSRNWRYDRA